MSGNVTEFWQPCEIIPSLQASCKKVSNENDHERSLCKNGKHISMMFAVYVIVLQGT